MATLTERLMRKIERVPESGCWIWTGGVDRWGYGKFRVKDKTVGTHRVSYQLHKGEIGGFHVLHKCDIPCCVNPDHLFLGTQKDNVQDAMQKGRHINTNTELRKIARPDIKC